MKTENYNSKCTIRWAFLYAGYEPEFAYWELIVLFRKSLFVLATVFLSTTGAPAQVTVALIILIAALSANLLYEPYDHDCHDELETTSLHCSIASLSVILLCNELSYQDGFAQGLLSPRDTIICSTVVFGSMLTFT